MKTIRGKLMAALEARGWTYDPAHRTRKYIVMMPPSGWSAAGGVLQPDARYFIGWAGALRYSSKGSASGSIPHDKTKAKLLAEVQ